MVASTEAVDLNREKNEKADHDQAAPEREGELAVYHFSDDQSADEIPDQMDRCDPNWMLIVSTCSCRAHLNLERRAKTSALIVDESTDRIFPRAFAQSDLRPRHRGLYLLYIDKCREHRA